MFRRFALIWVLATLLVAATASAAFADGNLPTPWTTSVPNPASQGAGSLTDR